MGVGNKGWNMRSAEYHKTPSAAKGNFLFGSQAFAKQTPDLAST